MNEETVAVCPKPTQVQARQNSIAKKVKKTQSSTPNQETACK